MDLTNPGVIKKLLNSYEQKAKKHFGQNFLINKSSLDKIVQTANLKASDHVIEIGPGLGALTQELLKNAEKVSSIELDSSLIPILKEIFPVKQNPNLELINQNALNFIPPCTPYKIVANIPYNITSPLINHFLQSSNKPKTITLLVQYEVAEKICELEPQMSILSLQIALFAKAKLIHKIPSSHFYPQPKVDSAILQIEIAPKVSEDEALKILKTAKRAFSQKRKKLSNTLPELKNTSCFIDLNRRPQTISVEEWIKLIRQTG